MVITGFDASRHQGELAQAGLARSDDAFGFLKITDGVAYRYVDWFFRNAPKVIGAGKILGAYHFLLDQYTGTSQARFYVQEVQRLYPGFRGVVPIVDIEREADGTTPGIRQLRDFVAEFRRLIPNRAMLIYTGRWYWVGVIGNPYGADLGLLWHSEYDGISPIEFDVANGPELEVYGGWTDCAIWQHTSSGATLGVNGRTDRNISYVSMDMLRALAGLSGPTPVPEEEDDMPYLHASPFTGIHVIDTVATWIPDAATVDRWTKQGIKVITDDTNEEFSRRFIDEHQPGGSLGAALDATHEDLVAIKEAIEATFAHLMDGTVPEP